MNSANQTNKFTKFLRNHAALLLLVFSIAAITTVVIVVSVGDKNAVEPVVVNPKPNDDKPVVNPDNPTDTDEPTMVKVYFTSPVNYQKVSMEYSDGTDVLFVFNSTLKTWATHKGVDLVATDGTEVLAMFDGVVVEVSESYGMGNLVKIDHGNNVVATYASLGEVSVINGQQVRKGEQIGTVSTSASYEFSDGAHLHLEVAVNGTNVDPMPYVDGEIFREVEQED